MKNRIKLPDKNLRQIREPARFMEEIILRPHHGMCFQFYAGKGYSADFTDHMGKVIKEFADAPWQKIRLMVVADVVCENCPHNESGICTSQEKVRRYDEEVLRACGLTEGDIIPYAEFLGLVKDRIITSGRRGEICADCSWDCICREMQPPAGCQGCAEEGAYGTAHPGASLPVADLNETVPDNDRYDNTEEQGR